MDRQAEKLGDTQLKTSTRHPPATKHSSAGDYAALRALRQIKAFARDPDLDCGCSSVLGEVMLQLEPRQRGAVMQELFASAIRQRGKVETLIELLGELDQFGPASDISEIAEAALIFEDVAQQARLASQFLRAFICSRNDVVRAEAGPARAFEGALS